MVLLLYSNPVQFSNENLHCMSHKGGLYFFFSVFFKINFCILARKKYLTTTPVERFSKVEERERKTNVQYQCLRK